MTCFDVTSFRVVFVFSDPALAVWISPILELYAIESTNIAVALTYTYDERLVRFLGDR
jgi:hypothetical protein